MRSAIGLMQRFGVPESLIGDLVERQRTHSALWFCRQSALAVLLTGGHEIVEHKWFAMRTLPTGWIVGSLVNMVVALALQAVQWTTDLGYALLIRPSGWYHLPQLIVHCVLMLGLGTAVMRLTRRHRAGVLLVWMTSPLPFATLTAWNDIRMLNAGVAGGWRGFPPDWVGWGGQPAPFIQTFQFAMLLILVVFSILAPLCVLLGGLWSGERHNSVVSS
jgi:hypothetical protein